MPIRLNRSKRDILAAFAERSVECPDQKKVADDAYDYAANLVARDVGVRFPRRHMTILQRYEVARPDFCIRGASSAGGVEGFDFRDDDKRAPLVPRRYCSSRAIPFEDETMSAVRDAALAGQRYRDALHDKRRDYRLLINSAKTYEEVVDAWPAAESVRDQIERELTSLTVLSQEMIARIRADNVGAEQAKTEAA